MNVFKKDFIKAKELPKSTNSSHNYEHSIYDIERKIKSDLGIFQLPAWLEILSFIFLGSLLFVVFLSPFIFIAKKMK